MYPVTPILRLLTLCTLLLALPALAAKVPAFPVPPKAKVNWVSRDMVMNGIAADVRQFYSKQKPERITRFYKDEWAELDGKQPGYVESQAMAPWTLLTRIEKGYMMNVQYQEADDGGTWGYLSLSKLPDKDAQPQSKDLPPAMQRSVVMSRVETEDPGQSGRSMVLRNDYSITSNVDYYRNYYKHLGWGKTMDHGLSNGKVHTLGFKNRLKEVRIVVMGNHQQSQVVFNEVEHGLF